MKQTVEYYYNLIIDKILLEGDTYHFSKDDKDYYFVPFLGDLKTLEEKLNCSIELLNKGIAVHNVVVNIKNEIITKVEDIPYLLLEVKDKDELYLLEDIMALNDKLTLTSKYNYKNNWAFLWSSKIDYIESQSNELILDNKIKSSLDFYIGLSETAISVCNNVYQKYQVTPDDKVTLAHKRIYYPNTALNYLNPISFIIDLEVRDIAEYIKSIFYNDKDAIKELNKYLENRKLSFYSYNMLLARLIYPSIYLDAYEKIVNKKTSSIDILKIIKKSDDYITFLKESYQLISKYSPLEKIEYLIY